MMATKERNFSPLKDLSLEELVSKDNFYRRLEEKLDLSFVRELVGDRYASVGRPSVDTWSTRWFSSSFNWSSFSRICARSAG